MRFYLFSFFLLSGSLLPGYSSEIVDSMALPIVMQPKKLAVFKNGLVFLFMEGKTENGKQAELKNVPIPSLGTFWLNVESPLSIKSVTSSPFKKVVADGQVDFWKLTLCNPGALVNIRLKGEGSRSWIGEILPVEKTPKPGNPNLMGAMEVRDERSGMISLKVEEDTDSHFVNIESSDIETMMFLDKAPKMPEIEVEGKVIKVVFDSVSPGKALSATCVSGGIAWVPEYRIDISNPDKAVFKAQAIVMNDLMDLKSVELNLVTGYPGIHYAGVASPISNTYGNVFDFLKAIGVKSNGDQLRRAPMAIRLADIGSAMEMGVPTPPLEGEQVEDLFFYPVKDFSCQYRETVMIPLFGGEIAYKDIYVWEIPEQEILSGWDSQRSNGMGSAQGDTSYDIWHCIRFTNCFSLPLTKGSIEFTSGGNIAGQGMIEFTSPGQNATVRLNKTLQVSVKREENTIATTEEKQEEDGKLVRVLSTSTIEGSLTIKNYSSKTMDMEINKSVLGTPVSATDNGSFSSAPGMNPLNPRGRFKWTIKLAPKEAKTIKYQYKRYFVVR